MIRPEKRSGAPALIAVAIVAAAGGAGGAWWALKSRAPDAPPAAAAQAPATAAPDATPGEIKIPEQYLTSSDIAVEAVRSGGVDTEILAPGKVEALPGTEATVVARAAGTVTKVNRHLGDDVAAGDVLALVESLEAVSMAAERSAAAAKAGLARKTYEREASLHAQGVSPRQDMETAQAALAVAQAEARRAEAVAQAARLAGDGRSVAVVSPIAGKVTAQTVLLGAYVQPQAELFRVAVKGAVHVDVFVTAGDAGRIAAGDKATIVTGSGAPVPATVHAVTPTVSGASQSATVVVLPDANAANLVAGDGVQARLHVKGKGTGMTVPEDAVQNLEGRDVLFVRTAQGFRPQPVLVGTRSGGVAQILSGVNAGDKVATRNAFLVKADMIKNKAE
jgi:cobalt-zinc-cadmium efflux system membrane fusion protein